MPDAQSHSLDAARRQLPNALQQSRKDMLVALCIGLMVIYYLASVLEVWRFIRALPSKIEVHELLSASSSLGFVDRILPIRHEPCGGFVFRLSDRTVRSIETRRMRFFNDAAQGRGFADPSHREHHQFSYAPWQETPLPYEWTSNGAWRGLDCTDWLRKPLGKDILAAVQMPNSYYTTAPSKLLLVLPQRGITVLTYSY